MHRYLPLCSLEAALTLTAGGCGCKGLEVAPTVPAHPAAAYEPTRRPRGGFVVYSADSTLVIAEPSTAGASPAAIEIPGLLVLDPARDRVVARNHFEWGDRQATALLWAQRCRIGAKTPWCARHSTELTGFTIETVFAGGESRQRLAHCDCVSLPYADWGVFAEHGFDTLDSLSDGDDGVRNTEDDGDDCIECLNGRCTSRETVAFFGGVLQELVTFDNNGCSGVHVANARVLETNVLTGEPATWPSASMPQFPSMRVDDSMGEIPWQVPLPLLPTDQEGERELECTPLDGNIWSVHAGAVVRSEVGTDATVSCAWHFAIEAHPALCLDPGDPCGSPRAFPALKGTEHDFWVSNDEQMALQWSDPPQLLAMGHEPLVVSLPAGAHRSNPVIGVRYHQDLARLLAVTDALLPLPTATPTGSGLAAPPTAHVVDTGDGRGWANHCFAEYKQHHLSAAVAACEQALELATAPSIRGAIYHSLGRIAEARRHYDDAIVYYRTSLRLRDHEATARALEMLLP